MILFFILGLMLGWCTRFFSFNGLAGSKTPQSTDTPNVSQTEAQTKMKELQKYTVNIPLKYFDADTDTFFETNSLILKGFFIDDLPQTVPPGNEIKVFNEVFDKEKICEADPICKISYGSSFDVDDDNKKEQVVSIFRGVNHGVEDHYILKNGIIIFEDLNSPASIIESKSHNGFYLIYFYDTFLAQPGQRKRIRYVYEQGKFVPVWSQTSTELQITQP